MLPLGELEDNCAVEVGAFVWALRSGLLLTLRKMDRTSVGVVGEGEGSWEGFAGLVSRGGGGGDCREELVDGKVVVSAFAVESPSR